MNKRMKKMLGIILVAVVIIAVVGILVGRRINSAKIENEMNLQYGGKHKPVGYQALPDKTAELQPSVEREIKEKFASAQIARVESAEGGDNLVAYTIAVTGEVSDQEFVSAISDIYIKYRYKGYKGILYLYIDNQIIGACPSRSIR